jgi:RHS repeat-associated protein
MKYFFYMEGRPVVVGEVGAGRRIVRGAGGALAQVGQRDGLLTGTRSDGSITFSAWGSGHFGHVYGPYGFEPPGDHAALLGYAGYLRDSEPGRYLLGNGHRMYSTRLMRFNSPDVLSPFAAGGLNAYAYSEGDPINRIDPSGRVGYQFNQTTVGRWPEQRVVWSRTVPQVNSQSPGSVVFTGAANLTDAMTLHVDNRDRFVGPNYDALQADFESLIPLGMKPEDYGQWVSPELSKQSLLVNRRSAVGALEILDSLASGDYRMDHQNLYLINKKTRSVKIHGGVISSDAKEVFHQYLVFKESVPLHKRLLGDQWKRKFSNTQQYVNLKMALEIRAYWN